MSRNEWEDPAVFERQREIMHAPWSNAEWQLSLDGEWEFYLAPSVEEAPLEFWEHTFYPYEWRSIQVPSNWQLLEDCFDKPVYTNIAYPFEPTPPVVPKANPTGCYRKEFSLPKKWKGRRVFLNIGSADSNCTVWVNGREVGYSEDSRLSAEFEITEFLREGEANLLAVRVMRWCSGFYLEDQDYWHLSGLQRSVTLFAKPRTHLRDFVARTRFVDASYSDAVLEADVWINDEPRAAPHSVRARLWRGADSATGAGGAGSAKAGAGAAGAGAGSDNAGALVAEAVAEVGCVNNMYSDRGTFRSMARFAIPVMAPDRWSAEEPNLYTLVFTLLDARGREVDVERARVGFRQVEIRDRQLLVNGRRMVVRGVDRHEFHPVKGRALGVEDMRAEIIAMKRLNFNAVRTSHYPNDPRWYDLCDELGMYIVDEANIETHGLHGDLSNHPAWMAAYMARAQRMVLRDRSHACVCVWSLGNESFVGPHHAAMAAWMRYADPTRPVQYESGNPGPEVTDIMAPMYPRFDWIRRVLADASERRPMIMCEYAYAKGNANGNFKKFWDLVDSEPSFQGGFIWDWADKALAMPAATPLADAGADADANDRADAGAENGRADAGAEKCRADAGADADAEGRQRYAHGGDFGDGFDYAAHGEDPTQVLNGIVGPTLVPHPGAYEVMHAQAPIAFEAWDELLARGAVRIRNKHQFIDLTGFAVHWSVCENGRVLRKGKLPAPPVPAGAAAELALGFALPAPKPGKEYWLNLDCVLRRDAPWADAGHRVAWEQFALPVALLPAPLPKRHETTAFKIAPFEADRLNIITIESNDTTIEYSMVTGDLLAWRHRGCDLIARGPVPCFSRAPTDNDKMLGKPGSNNERWQATGLANLKRELKHPKIDDNNSLITLRHTFAGADPLRPIVCDTDLRVHPDGALEFRYTLDIPAHFAPIPRIGAVLTLPRAYERLRWYGRGPWENYVDRKTAARLGEYSANVTDLLPEYLCPGESGGREDARWLELTTPDGATGIRIEGLPHFHFSALHATDAALSTATHLHDLQPCPETILHIDAHHMGLGGDTGWTPNVHPEYHIHAGIHRWAFTMRPIA